MSRFAGLWIALLLVPMFLYGQPDPRPFASPAGWNYVASENFDVFFTGENAETAARVARFAENARFELGVLYDYKPESRFALIYFNDANEQLFSNLILKDPIYPSGTIELPNMEEAVLHPGSNAELYAVVKEAVSRLILREFAFGDRVSNALQANILKFNPKWFVEGLSAYVASGWTYEDDMWLSSMQNMDILQLALEGDEHINRIARKSIWFYIGYEYGEQKISEIVYLVNISRSIEAGIISVLGVTLNTFSERWREFVANHSYNNRTARAAFSELPDLEQLLIRKGYDLLSFAYNEPEGLAALYLNKNGKQSVFLCDLESGEMQPAGLNSGMRIAASEKLSFYHPMAWSPNGKKLVTTAYRQDKLVLAYLDLASGDWTLVPVQPGIQKIQSLSWAHDNNRIAFSALQKGRVDLFAGKAESDQFRMLTDDPFDNLDPSWSFDDQRILFSSNRDSSLLSNPKETWNAYLNDFDIFYLEVNDKKAPYVQVTETPITNERFPIQPNSFEVLYITDESGIHNLAKSNIFLGATEPLTNMAQGIIRFEASETHVMFSTGIDGTPGLFRINLSALRSARQPEATVLRESHLDAYYAQLKKESQKKDQAIIDIQDPVYPSRINGIQDSLGTQEERPPVRYYIFDEEDATTTEYEVKEMEREVLNRKKKKDKEEQAIMTIFGTTEKPEMSSVEVSRSAKAPPRWSADFIRLGFGYEPVARFNLNFGLAFSDMLKHHRVEVDVIPFLNFRNWDARVRYSYLKPRVDLFAELEGSSRFLRKEGQFAFADSVINRYNHLNAKVGMSYPFSSFFQAGFSAGYHYIDKLDLQLLPENPEDDRAHLVRAGLHAQFDNTRATEGFLYAGGSLNFSANSYYSLSDGEFAFHNLNLNYRHYFRIRPTVVYATNIRSMVSLGNKKQQLYLGGWNDWILGVFLEETEQQRPSSGSIRSGLYDFQFQEFVTPMRGFRFNSRNGSQYVLWNNEIRIPVSRLMKNSLASGSLYTLELIPFLDVGTVWREGNPFSKKSPTDTQVIGGPPLVVELQTLKSPFLIGFGSGVRTQFIGYSARVDIAWGVDDNTLQKPILSLSMGKSF